MDPLSLLPAASITGPVVDVATDFIDSVGAVGVFVLMTLESACLPVPSEAVMLFAGFNVSTGDQSMVGIILAGMAGQMLGSWLIYGVGYYGRVELLEKNRLIPVGRAQLARVAGWFE